MKPPPSAAGTEPHERGASFCAVAYITMLVYEYTLNLNASK
uniref:Uncharacterized protein n=1 Tax=Anguilla anguilla TaxID=7936 RepID=A0A0E9TLZ7_ANGAN